MAAQGSRTLPAILREMFEHPQARAARARDFAELGLGPDASVEEIEAAFYDADALVLELTPEIDLDAIHPGPRRPRYRWHVDRPG